MDQQPRLSSVMGIFQHHLYELSKGMRPLVLMTLTGETAPPVVARLKSAGIAHYVHEACHTRLNVVFGRPAAVEAARRFMVGPLCDLSPEHDFMLGVLLGYDREQQCQRYLARAEAAAAPAGPGAVEEHAVPAGPVVIH
ncbi:DUF2023 family protein [Rhodovulum sp. PH10]|uniref:DUF2023 family protein n=1 Tax=Rhodovulum sp. PH10 TaxID=1187851 RepID=UPI00058FB087|nr:DUF2023 family protein [Rhodovulum sp. PH10]